VSIIVTSTDSGFCHIQARFVQIFRCGRNFFGVGAATGCGVENADLEAVALRIRVDHSGNGCALISILGVHLLPSYPNCCVF
jgi:hypothetical protein